MISRFYFVVAVVLVVVFTLVAVLIHTQAYDDHDLRALLIPDDCAMPCLMGITPGVTTMDKAIDILYANTWVGYVEVHPVGPGTSFAHLRSWAYWDWKADAPVWFRAESPVLGVHAGAIDSIDGVIENVTIATNISFGRFWLALGEPSDYKMGFSLVITTKAGIRSAILRYRDAAIQNDIEMSGETICQGSWNTWFQPSLITVLNDPEQDETVRFINNRPLLFVAHTLKGRVCSGG